jgi:hypothetical protein
MHPPQRTQIQTHAQVQRTVRLQRGSAMLRIAEQVSNNYNPHFQQLQNISNNYNSHFQQLQNISNNYIPKFQQVQIEFQGTERQRA